MHIHTCLPLFILYDWMATFFMEEVEAWGSFFFPFFFHSGGPLGPLLWNPRSNDAGAYRHTTDSVFDWSMLVLPTEFYTVIPLLMTLIVFQVTEVSNVLKILFLFFMILLRQVYHECALHMCKGDNWHISLSEKNFVVGFFLDVTKA